ncbi:MAG: TonB-dependent receptor [Caulobacter sp.]|nr:TonB-dependent receptor [Caulobacter sp.]
MTSLAAAVAFSGGFVTPARAEDSPPALEEVVVTARKREENVQTTPVSVSAVSQETIEKLNINRLENLPQVAPGLRVTSNGPSSVAPLIFLRGVGSVSVALYSEPPVGVYVDGVYFPRPTASALDLPDTSGIQVLRGPQGTLFGRNNTAGAILVTTQAPRPTAAATLNLGYGSDNDFTASAILHSGNIGDTTWRVKLVAQIHDRDGWERFPGYNRDRWGGSLHQRAFSFTVAGDILPNLKVSNRAYYGQVTSAVGWQFLRTSPAAAAYLNQSQLLGGPAPVIGLDPQNLVYRDPKLLDDSLVRSFGDLLTFDLDLGKHLQIKSITAYTGLDENLTGQLGGSAITGRVLRPGGVISIETFSLFTTPAEPGRTEQFSQELQATGEAGDFSYVGGLYFFREHNHETISTITASLPAIATGAATLTAGATTYTVATQSWAAYGQVNYKPKSLDERLELSVGLRYTTDKRGVDNHRVSTPSSTGVTTVANGVPDQHTWDNVGWSLSASYQVTDTIFAFTRVSSAFRAGGFNAASLGAPAYGPETAISYEAGVKSELFDRHLRVNVVGFRTNYDDLQINQRCPGCGSALIPGGTPTDTNFIVNAGSATYTGYEIEALAVLPMGFRVDANFGYVFPKYKEYIYGNPFYCSAPGVPATCIPGQPQLINFAKPNITGTEARFTFLSKYTFHMGAQWESQPTRVGVWTLRADYSYKSPFIYSTLDITAPLGKLQSSGKEENVSARIILSEIPLNNGNIKLRMQLFGDNLTNNQALVTAVDFGAYMPGIFVRPRNFGFNMTAQF